MQRHHAHRNRNKFRRRPTPPVVQSLVAGAQAHPRAAAVLRAVFVADERAYTGARCELPLGEVVEVTGRKTPFFALCRELDALGYGDRRIEISTPEGTPSMRGLVKAMAGLLGRPGRCRGRQDGQAEMRPRTGQYRSDYRTHAAPARSTLLAL